MQPIHIAKNEETARSRRDEVFELHASGEMDVFAAIRALDRASLIGAEKRKKDGVVYTPKGVALDICRLASPGLLDTVFEPSCGRGVFVFALAEFHLASHGASDVCAAMSKSLAACEIDPRAVADLRILWRDFWVNKGVSLPGELRVAAEDSLFGEMSKEQFDLALGNPPYVRFQHLPAPYRKKLQECFATCEEGNVDLFFAFVERSLVHCARSCLIFPNSWLASRSGRALRLFLATRTVKIADYGDQLVFAPVRAYVCIVLAARDPRPAGVPMLVQCSGLELGKRWEPLASGDARVGSERWTLSASKPLSKVKSVKSASGPKTLGDIATLFSGIATLSDSSYAIHGGVEQGGMAVFRDLKLGRSLSVELSKAPKKIKLTKVSSEAELVSWSERILYPYDAKGALLPFENIERDHPDMAAMLADRKERLSERDGGKQEKYPEWHAYGRKQGLATLPTGELCAMPVMTQGGIQCFGFDSAKTGHFLFTSGFVLAPKPGSSCCDILAALRAPASWSWALSHGKPWAGSEGKVYRSFGARLLLSMPLPAASVKTKVAGPKCV